LSKFIYDSEIVYKLIITISPILYILDIFYDVENLNKIFLLNRYVLLYLIFFFFYKNTFKFILYILIFLIPTFIGEIAGSIYLLSILFFMSFYKNIKFKKIFINLIIFSTITMFLLISQDYFRDNYDIRLKTTIPQKEQAKNYNYINDVYPYKEHFKFIGVVKNKKIFKIIDQILSRLSEVNHTIIAKKLLDTKYVQYLEGETYKRLPLILIPRLIYPDKPNETYGNILMCEFGIGNNYKNKEDCYANIVTSVNLNVILEGYVNYKILGLLFSAFCMALLAFFSFKLISHNKYYINVFGFVIMFQATHYSSNLSGLIGGIIFAIIAIVPLITMKQFNKISKLDR